MKIIHLFKIAVLSVLSISLLFMAGCRGSYNTSANVTVQLQCGAANCPVDGMTVSLQQRTGAIFTGVTDADGKANINVTLEGDYNVIQVAGLDASTFAESDETGREFVKTNPIADPYPNVNYTFGGVYPVINVPDFDNSYAINVLVPQINKVKVLKIASLSLGENDVSNTVSVGTAAFAGRVMISNFTSNDANFMIEILSNNADNNRLILNANTTAWLSGAFNSDNAGNATSTNILSIASYTQAGPVYFEAPGTGSGDWALGCNILSTELKTRSLFGGANATLNFPMFNGGANVLKITSSTSDTGHTYSFNYRIFQFEPL
jgi:hypothetical protein